VGATLRHWLTGLIAGLFALAVLPVPAEHSRAVIDRAGFALAYAMPDGTLPEICPDAGDPGDRHGGTHLATSICLACVVMAAPGLAARARPAADRHLAPVPAQLSPGVAVATRGLSPVPRRARAPPLVSIV
jgi:hypothetical protein